MHNMEKCGRGKGRPQGCSLRSHRRRRLAPLPPPFSPAPMLRHVVYASLLHFGVETAILIVWEHPQLGVADVVFKEVDLMNQVRAAAVNMRKSLQIPEDFMNDG